MAGYWVFRLTKRLSKRPVNHKKFLKSQFMLPIAGKFTGIDPSPPRDRYLRLLPNSPKSKITMSHLEWMPSARGCIFRVRYCIFRVRCCIFCVTYRNIRSPLPYTYPSITTGAHTSWEILYKYSQAASHESVATEWKYPLCQRGLLIYCANNSPITTNEGRGL